MTTYKTLVTPEELEPLVDLQASVWQTSDRNSTPHNMLMAITHAGGVIMAAISKDGQYVGFNFAIVAKRNGEFILWSHMTGILPEYQGKGIGKRLKFEQRLWALEHGYKRINWTTDPLQRGNANFNMRHLGCKAICYMPDHYGAMNDGLNKGLATDRFGITWELEDPRVFAVAQGEILPPITPHYPDEKFLVKCNLDNTPQVHLIDTLEDDLYFVEIPHNITAIKRTDIRLAKSWQLAIRQAVIPAIQQGYLVVDFARDNNRGWYILAQAKE